MTIFGILTKEQLQPIFWAPEVSGPAGLRRFFGDRLATANDNLRMLTIMRIMCDVNSNLHYLRARHFRAARILLAWTQEELAGQANVVRRTVVMLENGGCRTQTRKIRAVLDAFLAAGVRFARSEDGEISVIDATEAASTAVGMDDEERDRTASSRPRPGSRLLVSPARVSGRRRHAV